MVLSDFNADSTGTFTYTKNSVESNVNFGYHGIFDGEPDVRGWDKCSIDFANANASKLKNYIRKNILKYSDSVAQDSEDLYQDLLIDLYNAEDYIVMDSVSMTTSVDNYVYKRLIYLIDTYKEDACDTRNNRKSCVVKNEDGEYVEIFDNVACDTDSYEHIIYNDLESFLKPLESRRYEFGFDLFQVIYIRLVSLQLNISDNKCWEIVALLNNKEIGEIKECYTKLIDDENVASVIRAISIGNSLKVLEKYVYGVGQIKGILQSNLVQV